MSPNPGAFIEHLRREMYHSRSNKHSNALAEAIVSDLVAICPIVQRKAASGEIVYDLNFDLRVGVSDWNVDLVLGPPPGGAEPPSRCAIRRDTPAVVEIAVEIKSVMTEHRKAVKNRKRDLEAHHEHVHHYSDRAIAAGVVVINGAGTFKSPLRPRVTQHRNPDSLVEHCVDELRSVAVRGGATGYGLEAKCAIVVDFENRKGGRAEFVTEPPSPQVGDVLHYDAFIRVLCDVYRQRFG